MVGGLSARRGARVAVCRSRVSVRRARAGLGLGVKQQLEDIAGGLVMNSKQKLRPSFAERAHITAAVRCVRC